MVVMAVGAAVLVAAVVVSGEKSGEGMREIGRAAEAMVEEDGLRCEVWVELWWSCGGGVWSTWWLSWQPPG